MGATERRIPRSGPTTIAEALGDYGQQHFASSTRPRAIALEAALQVIAQFCDDVLPGLLDPVSRHRFERRGAAEDAPRDRLEAALLGRALASCARLLPYHVVAGSGVLEAFHAEAPRIVRWLARGGVIPAADARAFELDWPDACVLLGRHLRLQREIEAELPNSLALFDGNVVEGHFLIERSEPRGLWVNGGSKAKGPVRVPEACREVLVPGREVSLAFCRAVSGWLLVGSALPVPAGGLEGVGRFDGPAGGPGAGPAAGPGPAQA